MRTFLFVSLIGLLLSGCTPSSSSSSRKPAVVNKINGYVGASNIFKSTVFAAPVDVQGQPGFGEDEQGNVIGSKGISNSRAYYQLSLTEQESARPVVFIANAQPNKETTQRCELVDGCKDDTAYANGYPLLGNDATEKERFKLNAAVGSVGNNSQVNINWITHLAADIAYTTYINEEGVLGTPPTKPTKDPQKPVDGMFTPYTIERGNIWIKKQFGLGDIISVRPIAPSALSESKDIVDGLREQGIRYGALLAAGQQLAKDEGMTDVAWVSSVIDQQRKQHGQLFLNNAGASEFSMCKLYSAAESILTSNLEVQGSLPSKVVESVQSILEELEVNKNNACNPEKVNELTDVSVSIDEIKSWVDTIGYSKSFIDDLNERILNMRCDKGEEGFFDCDYVAETKQYYDDLELFYHNNKDQLVGALHGIRDDITEFIACLNDEQTTNPCTATEYKKDNLTYTLKPVESTKVEVDGKDKYYAFDFRITGNRDLGNEIKLTFNIKDSEEEDTKRKDTEFNYIRVVYQGSSEPYEVPAKLAFANTEDKTPDNDDGVEPLGFDINLPGIHFENENSTKDNPSSLKDFNLYFTAKLIGVKPLFENDKNRAMHYNLTEVAAGLNIQGNVLGKITENDKNTGKNTEVELKDAAEMTFTAKFINAANFYAKSLWPDKNDYFVTEAGVKAPITQTDLFKYSLLKDQKILISASKDKDGNVSDEVYGTADYFEIDVLGVGTNRYEVFEQEGKYALRSCFIDSNVEESKKEASKICRASEQVAKGFSLLDDLIYSDEKYFDSFAITGYGTYKPDIPNKSDDAVNWGDNGETWDGIFEASFSQGVDSLDLRIAQEFVDNTGSAAKRKPAAILKVKANKETDTRWEIAVSMGYNYKYLVGVLPSGDKDTQSLYFSYYVDETTDKDVKNKTFINELGSLSVMRDGTGFFGAKHDDKSANATIASRVGYEFDSNEDSSVSGCGYTDKKAKVDDDGKTSCNAVAYLTVRGSLVGTLRKENGLYVMRYGDGTFSILGI